MKLCKTEKAFIDAVMPAIRRACKRYGMLPSVVCAQSALENGFAIPDYFDNGGIFDLLEHNNMVGQKAELLNDSWRAYSVWPGKSFIKKTPEVYRGKQVIISDSFRIFDSIEQSFCDYILFLRYASNTPGGAPKYGPAVVDLKDPAEQIKAIRERGYATDPNYDKAVMQIIQKHNLTRYDDLTGVTPTKIIPERGKDMIDIIDRTRYNTAPRSRGQNPIQFIVIHYLGVPNADNPDLYGGGYGGHFYVSRAGKIYKAADPRKAVVWHCGGGLQGSGGHKFFGICTNFNSIGIECGVCYTETVRSADGDSDKWYFTTETQESLVKLVSYLMKEYGISIDHVIRHYDVTGKICPNPFVKNNRLRTSWTWDEFKARLAKYRGKDYLSKGDKGDEVKAAQLLLLTAGYSVGSSGADGDFGSETEKAVKRFQKDCGLAVNGRYGDPEKEMLIIKIGWKPTGTATARWKKTHIREGAGMKHAVIHDLGKGNRCEIDGKRRGLWYHVRSGSYIGWIHKTGLILD